MDLCLLPLVSVQGINYSWHLAKCFLSQSQWETFRSFLKWKYTGQISYQFHDDVVINWPSPSLQKLQLLCGCGRRSRLWWGRPRRSSPGRLQRTQGWRCRKCGRRRSSPSGLTGSLLPLCCPRNPGRHRNLPRPQRCSEWKDKGEECKSSNKMQIIWGHIIVLIRRIIFINHWPAKCWEDIHLTTKPHHK